ncbi:hypothetical protein [Bradyrhizobium elkanii]|uniref:hypothetical protein n=1 Tax=Bradyrhizobium elkanii TaxID=29448 RepID=UPI003518F43E
MIFNLYLDGDGKTGPLEVAEQPQRGGRGAAQPSASDPVHKILTNTCYSSGRWPYGARSSRDGRKHDPSTVIQIPVPVLIE